MLVVELLQRTIGNLDSEFLSVLRLFFGNPVIETETKLALMSRKNTLIIDLLCFRRLSGYFSRNFNQRCHGGFC